MFNEHLYKIFPMRNLVDMRGYLVRIVDKKYNRLKRKYFKYVIINTLTLNLIKKFQRKQKELREKVYNLSDC